MKFEESSATTFLQNCFYDFCFLKIFKILMVIFDCSFYFFENYHNCVHIYWKQEIHKKSCTYLNVGKNCIKAVDKKVTSFLRNSSIIYWVKPWGTDRSLTVKKCGKIQTRNLLIFSKSVCDAFESVTWHF